MQNQRWRDDKGSGSAMMKAEQVAQPGKERRRETEGRGGAMTKAEPVAQQ